MNATEYLSMYALFWLLVSAILYGMGSGLAMSIGLNMPTWDGNPLTWVFDNIGFFFGLLTLNVALGATFAIITVPLAVGVVVIIAQLIRGTG